MYMFAYLYISNNYKTQKNHYVLLIKFTFGKSLM